MNTLRAGRIRVSCPHCGHEGNISLDWRGSQRVRCRRCNGRFYPNTDRISLRNIDIQSVGPARVYGDIRDHPMFDKDLDIF